MNEYRRLAIHALRCLKDVKASRVARTFKEHPALVIEAGRGLAVMARYRDELARIDAAIEWLQAMEG